MGDSVMLKDCHHQDHEWGCGHKSALLTSNIYGILQIKCQNEAETLACNVMKPVMFRRVKRVEIDNLPESTVVSMRSQQNTGNYSFIRA